MIEQALRYQTKGDDWVKRVAIGGGLLGIATFFSFLLLPIAALFPVYGYLLEVIRAGLRGEAETPPEWGDYDFADLSVNGLKAFGILFVYGFAVSLIGWVPSTMLTVIGGALDLGFIALLGTLLGFVLYLVGVLTVAVVVPVALSNFVVEEQLSAGFDIDVLRNVIPEMAMLRAAGLGIVIYLIATVASSVISVFIITILLVPFILFVGISGMALVWGQGFAEAYETVYGELPTIPDGPLDESGAGVAGTAATAGGDDTTTGGHVDDTPSTAGESGADDTGADTAAEDGTDADDDERWEN